MPTSEKRERFLRLAEKRTNEVLERLRILGNCCNRKQYEYSEDDVKKMFSAVEKELRTVKALFSDKTTTKFSLR